MTNRPDSPVNQFRKWLSEKIDVHPEPGSFWCMRCSRNQGRTYIQYTKDPDIVRLHIMQHPPTEIVQVRSEVAGVKTNGNICLNDGGE